MAKKQNMKKAATIKPAASVRTNSSETKSPAQKTSKWRKFRSKLPPVFCESTTHEDKLCIFSFCCGIVLMACLFFGDLFIRNYLEARHWEEQVLHTLQIKLEGYNTKSEQPQVDKVIIVNQEDGGQKRIIKSSFSKKK